MVAAALAGGAPLGYRFQLGQGTYPTSASGTLSVQPAVRNAGWASPFNQRGLELLPRDTATGTVHKRGLCTDPRRWAAAATTTVSQQVSLSGIPAGSYRLPLNLPDPRPTWAAPSRNAPSSAATACRGTGSGIPPPAGPRGRDPERAERGARDRVHADRDLVADHLGLPAALGHDVRAGALAGARMGVGWGRGQRACLGVSLLAGASR